MIFIDELDAIGRARGGAVHTRNVPLASDVDLAGVAAATPGMVGADLPRVRARLLGMLTHGADPVRKVSIIPRGRAPGVTFQAPAVDRYGYSVKYPRCRAPSGRG